MIGGEGPPAKAQPGLIFFLLAFLFLLMVHLAIVATGLSPLLEGGAHGPDSYMRLVRVRQLYETGAWFDISIHRSNVPFGEELHWTRPADLVFLAGAWALRPLLGFERALYAWSALVSPLLHVVTTLVLLWAVAPFMDRERRFLLILTFAFQMEVWVQAMAARMDHHILILLTFAASLGFTVRLLLSAGSRRDAVLAGACAGFGLWLSVEFLVFLAAIFGALTLGWLRHGGELARRGLWHAFGLSAVVALALLLERPAPLLWSEEYDRISLVHLFIGLLAAAFWASVRGLERHRIAVTAPGGRIVVAVIGALVAGGAMLAIFPKFFGGPEVDYDPRLQPIFLDLVGETRSLVPDSLDGLGWFLLFLGSTVFFVIPYFIIRFLGDGWRATRPAWVLIGLALLLYLPLSLAMLRFSTYTETLAAIALADLMAWLLAWARRARGLPRRLAVQGLAVPIMLLGPFVGASVLMQSPGTGKSAYCDSSILISELIRPEGLGRTTLTVLARFFNGPEILYHTPHAVIATPYPRNPGGQIDAFRIYSAVDPEAARRLVEERGIDIIVTCRAHEIYSDLSGEPDMLESRLRRGEATDWLMPVDLSGQAAAEYRIYRVLR